MFVYIACVRICSGSLKGRRLFYPHSGLRPTKDITRQAIFNVLGDAVANSRVCELFAGAGGLGIEALSRGATEVVFIEKSLKIVRYLKENVAGLENVRIIRGDVFRVVPKLTAAGFDIVFADPPYLKGLAPATVEIVAKYKLVRIGGWLVLEHSHAEPLPLPIDWEIVKQRIYGESSVTFYRRLK